MNHMQLHVHIASQPSKSCQSRTHHDKFYCIARTRKCSNADTHQPGTNI